MATKVKLRTKPISRNRRSLYLDFYPPILHSKTGKATRRDFLGMYIYNPVKVRKMKNKEIPLFDEDPVKNQIREQHNNETLQLAELIRQRKENQLNKPEIYTEFEKQQLKFKEKGEKSFIDYFKKLADKKKKSNHGNWISAYKYLKLFTKGTLRFLDLNETFCEDFKDHLLTTTSKRRPKTTLAKNTAAAYFNKFKATLKKAYKDGYLQDDLNSKVQTIQEAETQRSFLTLEEVNRLAKTECTLPVVKQAALFSALTGLRFCDLKKMVWRELEYINGQGHFIFFRQEKSEGVEAMPISEQAYNLLGERKQPDDKVFHGLVYSAWTNMHLFKWLTKAGITKEITFHCFRHTYATLQLSKGTDIYTVSKMLGHRKLKTTEIYAKIIDQTKREAANKIQLDL